MSSVDGYTTVGVSEGVKLPRAITGRKSGLTFTFLKITLFLEEYNLLSKQIKYVFFDRAYIFFSFLNHYSFS